MLLYLIIVFFIVLTLTRRTISKIEYLERERETLEDKDHMERNEAVVKKYRQRLQQFQVGLAFIFIAALILIIWLYSY